MSLLSLCLLFNLDIVIEFQHACIFQGESGTTGVAGRAGPGGKQVGFCVGFP